MSKPKYDFTGWATRYNVLCTDGRTIKPGAFAHMDGERVSLVYNHNHDSLENVIGYVDLEARPEGMYARGSFNDSPEGQKAKYRVVHGDLTDLSIFANHLVPRGFGQNVEHGDIKEVSLVIAGANSGAYIDNVICHTDNGDPEFDMTMAEIFTGSENGIELVHSDDDEPDETLEHANKEGEKEMEDKNTTPQKGGKTVGAILETMNEEQRACVEYLVGAAVTDKDAADSEADKEGGNNDMKHNVFDNEGMQEGSVLCHADEEAIIELAKSKSVGSLKEAIKIYAAETGNDTLAHAFNESTLETFLPEYKLIDPAKPKTYYQDESWIDAFMSGISKSPISRVRTRRADARGTGIRAKGYKTKGREKTNMGNISLLGRTTDPTTVYVKDMLNRDDIIDITDFEIVDYNWELMQHAIKEEIALAIMVGDQREEGDDDKIDETKIRPIWTDDELYCITANVDIAAARASIQGTETGQHFSDNYVYAEAIIQAALYAREKYKGSGSLKFYCTPHLLNVMLLARDFNGRRIYDSKADLEKALNVKEIVTVEQFEGLTRTEGTGANAKTKKLLGLFFDLKDYQIGCVKGGEITKFDDFDIDFNQYKYLMETRLSGAIVEPWSCIRLEEYVTTETPQG